MHNKIGFALQYPDGSLAALDYSSGGYPYKADIQKAWITSEEKANDYIKNSNPENFTVVEVIVQVIFPCGRCPNCLSNMKADCLRKE